MKKGGKGGGNTVTGLIYEGKVDLSAFLMKQKGYEVKNHDVFYNGTCVAHVYKQHAFYSFFRIRRYRLEKTYFKENSSR